MYRWSQIALFCSISVSVVLASYIVMSRTTIDASGTPTARSFQRKTWFDGTRYWRSYLDEGNSRIRFDYSTDGTSWTEDTSAQIATNTDDFSLWADNSNAYIAYTTGMANPESSVTSGLMGQWKMNEASANTCAGGVNDSCDSSGNSNNGAWTGNATTTTGLFGNGVTFDGNGDYIQVADSASLKPGNSSVTMAAWINPNNANQTTSVFNKISIVTGEGYGITISGNISGSSTGKKITGGIRESSSGNRRVAITTADVVDGNWHHVAIVADKVADSITIYVDGVAQAITTDNSGTWPTLDNTDPLIIGSFVVAYHYQGVMDDVRVYNRALSSTEISQITELGYDVEVRKASSYPGTSFAWGSPTIVEQGNSSTHYFQYPGLAQDSDGKLWMTSTERNGSTYTTHAIRSTTANDITTWDTSTSLESSSNSNRYSVIIPRTSSKMMTIWIDGSDIKSKEYTGMAWDGTVAVATGSNTMTSNFSAVADSSGNIHLIYIDSTGKTQYKNYTQSTSPVSYPLKLSANASDRFLVDQNNVPFFWNGDSGWSLFAQLTDADASSYFTDRQARGFNVVVASLIEHKFATHAPSDIYSNAPFTGSAFTTPNTTYFDRVDGIIQAAAGKGIMLAIDPLYIGYNCSDEGWCSEIQSASTSDLQSWGTYVGNRYKNFTNIVWVIGGDVNPATYGLTTKVDAFATALKAADSNHLITAHNIRSTMAIDPWPSATWLNLNNVYSTPTTYTLSKTAYDVSPVKPFFLIEGYYENEHSMTRQALRAQAYWTLLSGAMGHFMGSCPRWSFGFATNFCDSVISWSTSLSQGTSLDMTHLNNFFRSIQWQTLVPDWTHTVLTSGYGTYGNSDYVTSGKSASSNLFVAYLPTTAGVTVNMASFSGSTNAYWFDPVNGTRALISGSPFANSGSHVFTPTGNNSGGNTDWVLLIESSTATVWSSDIALDSNAGNAYPTLSYNSTNGNLYALWIRGSTIYYKKGVSTYTAGDWDASPTSWQASGTNTYVTSNYSGAGYIFAEWYNGSAITWAKIVPGIVSITLTTDGTINYGTVSTSGSTSTVTLGDTQTVQNDGTVPIDVSVKTSNATGGTTWTLGGSPGSNIYTHEFSTNGGSSWTPFTTADSYQSMASNIALAGTKNLDLRITLPTSTADFNQKSITVTIMASEY